MIRRILAAWYRWHLSCIEAEREGYQASCPHLIGPNYLSNCAQQERELRGRIAVLEVQA